MSEQQEQRRMAGALGRRLGGLLADEVPVREAVEALVAAVQAGQVRLPLTDAARQALAAAEAVASADVAEAGALRPLVLEAGCLYLWRYWRLETALAAGLRARLIEPILESTHEAALKRAFAAGEAP
ncbi:MAG: hypothetical protein ACOCVG_01795, partial [Verrucomicrobiota bacterium]